MSTAIVDPTNLIFPDCVLATVGNRLLTMEAVTNVEYRGLSMDDPKGTVGFDVTEWVAGEAEMAGFGKGMIPATADYLVTIEFLYKHSNSAVGERLHRQTTRDIRTMLYADDTLAVALAPLSRTADGIIERMLRWKVIGQRSGSSKINSAFVSLSATEFTFTTEIVPE